jgi:hypothetical protein
MRAAAGKGMRRITSVNRVHRDRMSVPVYMGAGSEANRRAAERLGDGRRCEDELPNRRGVSSAVAISYETDARTDRVDQSGRRRRSAARCAAKAAIASTITAIDCGSGTGASETDVGVKSNVSIAPVGHSLA